MNENKELNDLDLTAIVAGLNKGTTTLEGLDRENDPNFVARRNAIQKRQPILGTQLR